MRHTKICATLGPSSLSPEKLHQLVSTGVDVFRINMSHTPRDKLAEIITAIRHVEAELVKPTGILVDLQGPKLRLGVFADEAGVFVSKGGRLRLDRNTATGDRTRVHLPHSEILDALNIGERLLIDDGKLCFEVVERDNDSVTIEAIVGGQLKSRKGVSLPDTLLPLSALSEQDRADLIEAIKYDIEFVALSFVQRPEDINEVKALIGDKALVLAKIEKPQAVRSIEAIFDVADGVMVARGDLGVEMPMETVPGTQKHIIAMARKIGKPVIVATQMLESMINAPVPTRAEVSDVASAVYDGADTIMLSGESAVGDYPVEAVETMVRVATEIESDHFYQRLSRAEETDTEPTSADAISAAARTVAEAMRLPAIVCYTTSGATAYRVARQRPDTDILVLSPEPKTVRALTLLWGVRTRLTEDARDFDDMVLRACFWAHKEGLAKPGDRIIVVAGVPLRMPGKTNLLRIAKMPLDIDNKILS